MQEAYRTSRGVMFHGDAEAVIPSPLLEPYRGKVQLVFTSPPFPLTTPKAYGNRHGDDYLRWFTAFAPLLADIIAPDGSIVIEMGNVWEPGRPTMSTVPVRTLLAFQEAAGLYLCQAFIAHNRRGLAVPAQWVAVERIRVKDAFTHLWWFAKTPRPKADNRRVLVPYSPAMRKVIETKRYTKGTKPSGHRVSDRFDRDNGGAIPPNLLTYAHPGRGDAYLSYCRANDIPPHPARMHDSLPEFFIKFLTDEDDIVLDPFAGSNVTGAVAERLGRRWVAIERQLPYVLGSRGRFLSADGFTTFQACAEAV